MLEKVANTEKRCLLSANLWIFAWRLNNKHIQAYCDDLDTFLSSAGFTKIPYFQQFEEILFHFQKELSTVMECPLFFEVFGDVEE